LLTGLPNLNFLFQIEYKGLPGCGDSEKTSSEASQALRHCAYWNIALHGPRLNDSKTKSFQFAHSARMSDGFCPARANRLIMLIPNQKSARPELTA
jgi:hypothetical protein